MVQRAATCCEDVLLKEQSNGWMVGHTVPTFLKKKHVNIQIFLEVIWLKVLIYLTT